MNDPTTHAIATWIAEGPDQGPPEVLARALATGRATRQRPAWRFPQRWLPVEPVSLPVSLRWAALAILLLAAVVAAALAIGASRPKLPPPFGPARNGTIAFDTGTGGGIWLADADGTHARRLAVDGVTRSPVHSPDGTRMAFWRRATKGGTTPLGSTTPDPLPTFELWLADGDGANPHPVTGVPALHTVPGSLVSWSPDGRELVFAATVDGVSRLVRASVDGTGPPVTITDPKAGREQPTWSPDGRWIAYRWSTLDGRRVAIGLARPDGTGELRLQEQSMPDDGGGFATIIAWAPDSRHLVTIRGNDPASATDTPYAAYLVDVDVAGRRADSIVAERSGWLDRPAWSPDGRQFAYVTGETQNVLWVADADGTSRRMVAACAGLNAGSVTWAPDGRSILGHCDGRTMLFDGAATASPVALPLPVDGDATSWQRLAP